jgi:predicted transcriptional regulator
MLASLPPRERQIVDILYQRGASTVAELGTVLDDELSGSAIRAMLARLERKGFVAREQSERGYTFAPRVPEKTARKSVLGEVVRVFFNGSPASAAVALLGMHEALKPEELDELERMIARAREGKML